MPTNDALSNQPLSPRVLRTGWTSHLAWCGFATLIFEAVTGLVITVAPFHAAIQWSVLVHTGVGAITLLPLAWYCVAHVADYRRYAASHITVLGWLALGGLTVCSLSGLVVAGEALWGLRSSLLWRNVHLIATLVLITGVVPHLIFVVRRQRAIPAEGGGSTGSNGSTVRTAAPDLAGGRRYFRRAMGVALVGVALTAALALLYSGTDYANRFPEDYSYLYGTNRPFAPSLARTDTGGAFDARSLAGSKSCGTAGCHDQILEEWLPSAHRYAAMDTVFLGIQDVMAKQNGPESTRYCGGCHDPISLFSGTKNIFVENLTGLHGYQEGVSCLACHAIRETDIKGNANYTVTQPREYLWQWQTNGVGRVLRDFLIRSYPEEHGRLAKRAFKKPEYCAACHKQFIDAEVNRVGWVQLQNQYDNWAASHWNHKGDARKTVECRECHMPLVESRDPAAGDPLDYNRSPGDRRHRSHRFIAANTLIPYALRDQLEGADEQLRLTDQWLRGGLPIPEIEHKWARGPIVTITLEAPETIAPGGTLPLRVVMASNKVGHDFPTGPLDIIQSWLEITVTDDHDRVTWTSGRRDQRNFLEPGTFLFKAEPVDQHGNLIDRHNLWEMVGVRFRRALFPGYSDAVQFAIPCAGSVIDAGTNLTAMSRVATPAADTLEIPAPSVPAPLAAGEYRISVALQYRKVDQFLLNYLFGETNQLTAPVTELARVEKVVRVQP
ncbi:MAG: hypothetical protein JNK85_29850 [Verrucomicrobiales bacterium]|nr:hypothetical protein [Verrucomicrobiales bacterium]